MKTVFIEARSDNKIRLPPKLIERLPQRTALFMTVQFIDNVVGMIRQIEDKGKKVIKIKPKHCMYECQLLGCSIDKFREEFDGFLFVGDGEFHPKALMLKNGKPVFVYNPYSEKYFKLEKKDVDKIKKRQKGALLKFYSSKEVGILISTKPGQYKMKEAEKIEKKYPDKNFYKLIADTIDFSSLEDFNFIECLVNTACPRIAYDDSVKISRPILDIDDLI